VGERVVIVIQAIIAAEMEENLNRGQLSHLACIKRLHPEFCGELYLHHALAIPHL